MYKDILNELRTPVFLLNDLNNIEYINLSGEEFFGLSAKMIVGKPLSSFVKEDSQLFILIKRVRGSGFGLTEESLDLSNIDYPNRKARVHLVPVSTKTNTIIVQISQSDLSEMIQTQTVSSKISKSFSSMIDMLMHELKNPLAGIKGASQLIKTDIKDNENLLELIELIFIESDRIVSLLNRMEQISNNNIKLSLQSVNIHEILSHCRLVAQNSFGNNIEFLEDYDPSLPNLNVDKDLIIQIILNLLKNACESYTSYGKVKIKTTYNSNKLKSYTKDGVSISLPLQIEIIDYGSGIPNNLLPNIFDPFVTSKMDGKGLGLAVVASGLEELGATISVSSEEGLTCFKMNFPL